MSQRIVCRSGPATSSRLGSVSMSTSRVGTPFGRSASLRSRVNPRSLRVSAVLEVNEGNFEAEVLKADLPVLVDFWATWCGPCKLVAPSMVWAEKEFGSELKVVKMDCTNDNKSMMEKYKVYGLPCLIIFKDGQEMPGTHREGAITRKDLGKYLEKHVGVKVPAA